MAVVALSRAHDHVGASLPAAPEASAAASNPVAVQPRSQAPQIAIDRLSKEFIARNSRVQALADVSLTVEKGQFCCLVGPSGCGKTTLLRIVAGLETHTSGTLRLAHFDRSKPLHSMVFQEQSVFPWMTVEKNVEYGLRMRGVTAAERRDIVRHYIDKVGLSAFREAYPHQLSGGMKQRVSIARAFANDPDPTRTGDPIPNEPATQTATDLPMTGDRSSPTFADLDTDADGYLAVTDIPVEHELSLQFAVADSDQDDRLSQAEFAAYQDAPEEEEAEE